MLKKIVKIQGIILALVMIFSLIYPISNVSAFEQEIIGNPKTGDSIMRAIIILAVGVVGILIILISAKKDKKKKKKDIILFLIIMLIVKINL